MDDKQLRQRVLDELEFDPSIDTSRISVAVEDGVVTLNGHVGSYYEKSDIERVVRRVKGVTAIAEEIGVRYPSDKKISDDMPALSVGSVAGSSAGKDDERRGPVRR